MIGGAAHLEHPLSVVRSEGAAASRGGQPAGEEVEISVVVVVDEREIGPRRMVRDVYGFAAGRFGSRESRFAGAQQHRIGTARRVCHQSHQLDRAVVVDVPGGDVEQQLLASGRDDRLRETTEIEALQRAAVGEENRGSAARCLPPECPALRRGPGRRERRVQLGPGDGPETHGDRIRGGQHVTGKVRAHRVGALLAVLGSDRLVQARAGADLLGLGDQRDALFLVAPLQQESPQPVQARHVRRVERERLAVRALGILPAVGARVDDPQVVVGHQIVGIESSHRFEVLDGLLEISAVLRDQSEVVARVGIVRIEGDRALEQLFGLVDAALLDRGHRRVVEQQRMLGPQLERAAEGLLGLGPLLLSEIGRAEHVGPHDLLGDPALGGLLRAGRRGQHERQRAQAACGRPVETNEANHGLFSFYPKRVKLSTRAWSSRAASSTTSLSAAV